MENDTNEILVQAFSGGEESPDVLYKVNIYTSRWTRVAKMPLSYMDIVTNNKGEPILAFGMDTYGNYKEFQFGNGEWKDISDKLNFVKGLKSHG
ncbi:MAG: hypothetical protein HWD86_11110 [Kangiellaceae bacterium]|nr:hypothetical protein [Kangiellaceae bacterium]